MNTRRRKTTSKERTCPTCSRQFAKAERLERHLRTHTREKPFQCLVCEKYYSRQDTLLRHSKSHGIGAAANRTSSRREPNGASANEGPSSPAADRRPEPTTGAPTSSLHHRRPARKGSCSAPPSSLSMWDLDLEEYVESIIYRE